MPSKPVQQATPGFPYKRIIRFAVVGVSGVAVNEGMLILLHGIAALPLWVSSVCAVETSIVSNFLLNSFWTWRYDFQGSFRVAATRCLRYHAVTGASALVANVVLLLVLVRWTPLDYRGANLIAIAAASLINFVGMEFWVFRR